MALKEEWHLKYCYRNCLKAEECFGCIKFAYLFRYFVHAGVFMNFCDGKKVMNGLIWVFCCTETRQRFRATWRCISLRLNSMIFDFFTTFFGVGERFSYSLSHFLSQTVLIFDQRLTRTENKLRECLDNQQKITLQIRPNE